jgi:plastocyanin
MQATSFLALLLICTVAIKADAPGDKDRHEVSIKNLQFKPATIKIKAGQTVTWTNNDDRDHTVSFKEAKFQSDNLKPGQTYEHTFPKPGKFPYVCRYHPRMKGEVVVE